jgi:predicted flap endonuclease-1-like 5' DNA nuclease
MWYLVSQFWLWLLVALVLGLVVGWVTFKGRDENFWRGLIPWGILLGLGTLIAVTRLFKDGGGFWVDLGMLLAGSYFVGCFLGYLLRLRKSESETVAVAAPVAVAAREVPVEPMKAAPVKAEADIPEEAITGLSGPRNGKADNLTCIYGIDDAMETKLNSFGIYHHDQLASMSPGQRRWLFRKLGYEGRFPSWWWRWKYDAEQIVAGKLACPPKVAAVAPTPVAAAPVALVDGHAGAKPKGLATPRGGKADDLKRIRGIGKQNEGRLHALGIWHFDQVAAWSADEALWVGSYLAFPGRIEREEWIAQAKVLAAGKDTEFSKRVAKGLVATSADSGDKGQGNVAKLPKPASEKPAAKKPPAKK